MNKVDKCKIPGSGRKKGVPNKITGDIKDMVKRIVDYIDTAITIPALLEEIWANDPVKILDFLKAVSPKSFEIFHKEIPQHEIEREKLAKLTDDEMKELIRLFKKMEE